MSYIPPEDFHSQRRDIAIKEEKKNRQTSLKQFYLETEENAYKAQRAKAETDAIWSTQHSNAAYAKEYAYPSLEQRVMYLMVLPHYPTVYLLNCILIREPMAYLGGNFLALFVPALLLLLEIGLCAILFNISEHHKDEFITNKHILTLCSRLLILVTPGLVLASFLAKLDNWSLLELSSELIALSLLMVIAAASDVMVVLGFTTHRKGFAFLFFQLGRLQAIWQYKRLDEMARQYALLTQKSYFHYHEILSEFNADFPEVALTPHRFSATVEAVVNGNQHQDTPPF